jgi:hypothetical protein
VADHAEQAMSCYGFTSDISWRKKATAQFFSFSTPQLHVICRAAVICIAEKEQLQAWPAFI